MCWPRLISKSCRTPAPEAWSSPTPAWVHHLPSTTTVHLWPAMTWYMEIRKHDIYSQKVTHMFCSWVNATWEWDRAALQKRKNTNRVISEGFPSWLEISDHVFTVKQSEGENRERGDPGTGEAIEFSLLLFPLLPRSRGFQVDTKLENTSSLDWLWPHSWVIPQHADPTSAMSSLPLRIVANLGNLQTLAGCQHSGR